MNGPKSIDIWQAGASTEKSVHYVVLHPWQWVMESLVSDLKMNPIEEATNLPTAKQQASQEVSSASPRRTRRNRGARQKTSQGRTSLRMEIVDNSTGQIVLAAHGTSACFDGLGDKDELVRTFQRCRCEHVELSPPSILIQWDVTKEECNNLVGSSLPRLGTAKNSSVVAVLKEPMGSRGRGIYFVRTADEIHAIIDENHQKASADPDLLENLIAAKGRIPSWVLQAEVAPALLIRNRRKFHIRSYVVVVERPDDEVLDMLIYGRHEVRIAGVPVDDGEGSERSPAAHITNGALSSSSERVLLSQVPELVQRKEKLELFIAETFGKFLLSDISRRIPTPNPNGQAIREFAVAGLDLMVTEDFRIYLLVSGTRATRDRNSLSLNCSLA
mmetsp:Transcript_7878/g.17480  ORF Transcript_7878/g.17480 Transcript_7878/m.17480 type:complete len:387 (-) Transcript_7878:269-1429(-)